MMYMKTGFICAICISSKFLYIMADLFKLQMLQIAYVLFFILYGLVSQCSLVANTLSLHRNYCKSIRTKFTPKHLEADSAENKIQQGNICFRHLHLGEKQVPVIFCSQALCSAYDFCGVNTEPCGMLQVWSWSAEEIAPTQSEHAASKTKHMSWCTIIYAALRMRNQFTETHHLRLRILTWQEEILKQIRHIAQVHHQTYHVL